jgi:hypothetical protein
VASRNNRQASENRTILNDRSNLHFLRIAENLTAANTASKTSCLGWRKQLSAGS